MAYQSKDLSVLAYANGFTLWHYATADAAAAVDSAGYFNAAAVAFYQLGLQSRPSQASLM